MSVTYSVVQWNRHKRIYDTVMLVCIVLYVSTYAFIAKLMFRGADSISDEILAIRALGSCAFLMLHVVLCIGPLARLDRRFLPLLYNRRHLGVATFLVALAHGVLVTGYYHGFGHLNPLISLLSTNTSFLSLRAFPFQILGLAALLILFLMAATSHDFWNRTLGPTCWKSLHMLVYPAFALAVLHVALGAWQSERGPWFSALVLVGPTFVASLHLIAGGRERRIDHGGGAAKPKPATDWVDVCGVEEVVEQHGRTVCIRGGERIALFRHNGAISAITNVCAHQGGPLGEGRIIDGCVTCPWHGWQYRPTDGQSPPPFKEKIATYRVRIEGQRVLVDPRALPPGTPVDSARITEVGHE